MSYAECKCSWTHSIGAMLTAMSARTQYVSVLVCHLIVVMLTALLCRMQAVSILFLYAFNRCHAHCYVVCMQAVSILFLYAFNRCSAHCYIVSYAGCKCSCTHATVAMLMAMSCPTQGVSVLVRMQLLLCSLLCRAYAGCKCSCTHANITVLTTMSCRTQCVSVRVCKQSLTCSLLCPVARSV